ncbi:GNAT family N-acetyltransferase, partial [Nonomuraea rhizosphaerae]|uniref:GNAT family N-acetyltransferase n=1 Tax=Nonomuraea rhizosphaerae TaxID=2665663 RepID=UPI001C5F14FE
LLAEEEATLQGFVYLLRRPGRRILLDNLHVLPARKRSGVGRQLMRRAFTWAATEHPGATVYLEVIRGNAPAIAFYQRCGGVPARTFVERLPAGFDLPMIEYVWTPDAVNAFTNS